MRVPGLLSKKEVLKKQNKQVQVSSFFPGKITEGRSLVSYHILPPIPESQHQRNTKIDENRHLRRKQRHIKDTTNGAPGLTRNKDATLGAPGLATRNKDATRNVVSLFLWTLGPFLSFRSPGGLRLPRSSPPVVGDWPRIKRRVAFPMHLFLVANLVATSKALVTTSVALVSRSEAFPI